MVDDAEGLRILVVDDDPDVVELLSIVLRRRGMRVVAARDGLTALEEARHLRPHVAIIDLGLPHLDGCQLARRLGALPERPRLIALTGDSSDQARKASQRAGFAAYVLKPARHDALLRLVVDLGRAAA